MSKLPQVNVRLAPEHHALVRELAQRLRADPSLAVELAQFLADVSPIDQIQVSPLAPGLTDEVADLKERLEHGQEFSRRIMAFAENINERVKAMEDQMAGMKAARSKRKTKPGSRLPDDVHRQIHDLDKQGMTRDQVAAQVGVATGTVSNYLKKPRPPG
jgi:hypothetical protein